MTVLSDGTILKRLALDYGDPQRIVIDGLDKDGYQIQPASVDLRLGTHLALGRSRTWDLTKTYFALRPHGAVLATTHETVGIPSDLVARVEGKSSIGRQHVIIHCTAGWLDPGFGRTGTGPNEITLEIVNHSDTDHFLLTHLMPICQLTFLVLDAPALNPYHGKYLNQQGPTHDRTPPLTLDIEHTLDALEGVD